MKRIRPVDCLTWVPLLCLVLASPQTHGAAKPASGRDIYRQQCAKCHGKNGEGVKSEYKEALVGDWPLEKLSRYIHKSMPDDKPKTLDTPSAEAVARYIYDEFYSPAARVRKNPPRVELVRLTNRQYVNTVADLVKSFTGADAPPGGERGLRVSYGNSQRGRGGRGGGSEQPERVDRGVNFDFLREGSEPAAGPTNGFSAKWSGALIAEESGDHEFILITPNGARLWLNDDEDKPLIDAGVASGTVTEYRATLRLLGGRAYPIRLEWFKAPKDKQASVALQWKPPHGAQQVIPARNLSPARVSPTFVVTTAFPADDSSVGYERGVAVSKAWDEAATQAAIETANYIARHLDQVTGSKPTDKDRAAKAQHFCLDFVAAAIRRPLDAGQKRQYVISHFQKQVKVEDAVTRVVLLALKSPRFLYLGLDSAKPDNFEVAARLSFYLWDSLPDRELVKLAAQGGLHTREQIVQQARRMLDNPRARAKVQNFFQHWLQMNRADDLAKDEKLFPDFTPEIIADLRTSLNLFLDDVFWSSSSDYRRLLLDDDLRVNDRLAKFYGLSTNALEDFVKVSLDPKERAGVVTHPYLLASFSYQKYSSPIHRGVFLTRNIVGRSLKSPPMAVAFKDEEFDPKLSMREKVAALTRSEACQTCHAVINPLGFSLEQYDAVGRFRASENGKPIDATADYVTDDGNKVRFQGARDLAEFAAANESAQNGFVEQLFHQVVKQPLLAYGADTLNRLRQSFVTSGFNMQQLLVEIAVTGALHGVEKPGDIAKAK